MTYNDNRKVLFSLYLPLLHVISRSFSFRDFFMLILLVCSIIYRGVGISAAAVVCSFTSTVKQEPSIVARVVHKRMLRSATNFTSLHQHLIKIATCQSHIRRCISASSTWFVSCRSYRWFGLATDSEPLFQCHLR